MTKTGYYCEKPDSSGSNSDYTRILFAVKPVTSRTEKVMGNVSVYSAIFGCLPPKTV